jgi:hypothetical protein
MGPTQVWWQELLYSSLLLMWVCPPRSWDSESPSHAFLGIGWQLKLFFPPECLSCSACQEWSSFGSQLELGKIPMTWNAHGSESGTQPALVILSLGLFRLWPPLHAWIDVATVEPRSSFPTLLVIGIHGWCFGEVHQEQHGGLPLIPVLAWSHRTGHTFLSEGRFLIP